MFTHNGPCLLIMGPMALDGFESGLILNTADFCTADICRISRRLKVYLRAGINHHHHHVCISSASITDVDIAAL